MRLGMRIAGIAKDLYESNCASRRHLRCSRVELHHTPRSAPGFLLRRGIVRGQRESPKHASRSIFLRAFSFSLAVGLSFAPPARAQQPPQTPPRLRNRLPLSTPPATVQQVQGYTLTPAQEAQAIAYARARHELYFLDVAYGLLLLVLMLQLRVAPDFRDWAARWTEKFRADRRFYAAAAADDRCAEPADGDLGASPGRAISAIDSGMGIVAHGLGQGRRRRDGDRRCCWSGFCIAVIRKSPRKWWFYFWLAAVPLIILGAVVEPLIVEPLFYKFTPLAEFAAATCRANIEQVTMRAGAPIPQEPHVRNERQLETERGECLRLRARRDQARRRVGHDHPAHEPRTKSCSCPAMKWATTFWATCATASCFPAPCSFFFFISRYRSLHWMLARWGETWAIRGPDDLASLPVLILLLTVFGFLFTPISNAYSRHLEHQADQYGLEVIHGLVPDAPVVAAHAFQVLGEVDLEEPNPSTAVKFWFYNHPPLDERMRFAQTYDPWSQGRAPEFVTRCAARLSSSAEINESVKPSPNEKGELR